MKLQRYIDNIKELKNFWKNAIDTDNFQGFKRTTDIMSSSVPRQAKSARLFDIARTG